MTFDGKVALVTGGASGIGLATVEALRAAGTTVIAADRNPGPDVEPLDVTDERAVDALIATIIATHGRLDLAANVAGVSETTSPIVDKSTAEWHRVLRINLDGVFFCLRAELRSMLANGPGSIVNVASAAGVRGVPGISAYVASKHAVIGLTRTAAAETVRSGLRVNCVCPGTTMTPMVEAWADTEQIRRLAREVPMGRLGAPEEIAAAIVWLLSDQASFVTGHTLMADGGVAAF